MEKRNKIKEDTDYERGKIRELTRVSLSRAAFAELIPPPYLHMINKFVIVREVSPETLTRNQTMNDINTQV